MSNLNVEFEYKKALKNLKIGNLFSAWKISQNVHIKYPYNTRINSLLDLLKKYNSNIANQNNLNSLLNDLVCKEQYLEIVKYSEILKNMTPQSLVQLSILAKAYYEIGRYKEAISVVEQCINLDRKNANNYALKGYIQLKLKKIDKAEINFKKSIKLKKDFENAYIVLGSLYFANNNYNAAIQLFKSALKFLPNNHKIFNNLGFALIKLERFSESIRFLERSIQINQNNFDALNNLALSYLHLNEIDKSINISLKLNKLDPYNTVCLERLATLYKLKGNLQDSLICSSKAYEISPTKTNLQNLASNISNIKFKSSEYCEKTANVFINILQEKDIISFKEITDPIISYLYSSEFFKKLISTNKIDLNLKDIKSLHLIPLFLMLIKKCMINDLKIENFIKLLRQKFLTNKKYSSEYKNLFPILEALSFNSFNNDYLYGISKKEEVLIEEIEVRLKSNFDINNEDDLYDFLCLSWYKPVQKYSFTKKISNKIEFKEIYEKFIINHSIEQNYLSKIPRITSSKDLVSKKVKSQYEAYPYPKWESIRIDYLNNHELICNLEKYFNLRFQKVIDLSSDKQLEILVAGCGTGQESMNVALLFQKSKVIGIDLSLKSLAYALRKKHEYNIKNIDYYNLDILKLDKLNQKYDMIFCSGVLHHMENPSEGLSKLVSHLNYGGLIKIGLYSSKARRNIIKLRNKIKFKNINSSDIIRYRNNLINKNNYHALLNFNDFFSLNEFKDLLFNIKENTFNLLEVREMLNEHNLKFCGFDSANYKAINTFKNQKLDISFYHSFEKWNEIEIQNPDLFSNMYQFWVQKV